MGSTTLRKRQLAREEALSKPVHIHCGHPKRKAHIFIVECCRCEAETTTELIPNPSAEDGIALKLPQDWLWAEEEK